MNKLNRNTWLIAAGTLLMGFFIGWIFFSDHKGTSDVTAGDADSTVTIWTCAMHPQIRQSEPGQCPICGMDLIPLNSESAMDPMEIRMSPTAMQLASVQTSIINLQKPVKEVRMNGKVKADERQIYSQSSHIPGRIEQLMISFTGEQVSKGQILAYVYSPELVTAQEELFEAFKYKDIQPQLYLASRTKLKNWKLTESQIDKIVESGEAQEQFPILSDVTGIVLSKNVNLGDYIRKGQTLFEVADLTRVWVLFDVYESDMPWIKTGDEVQFTVQSLPGESFKSRISFIDPVVNPRSRVASARLDMANPGMKLKPDMFVLGLLKSPMQDMAKALIVPKSAVMWTGERSVVYVKKNNTSGISFIMREVTLGPTLGDSYIVTDGLKEGEEIATNGTFSIDAAAQLAGKPSMMNPEGGMVMTGHNHGANATTSTSATPAHNISISHKAKQVLSSLLEQYLSLKEALVADEFEKGKEISASLLAEMNRTNMSVFSGQSHTIWMKESSQILDALRAVEKAENIGEVRKHFKEVSDNFILLAVTFGPFDKKLYIQHCPMAITKQGADWISDKENIENPYFGNKMLRCGEIIKKI